MKRIVPLAVVALFGLFCLGHAAPPAADALRFPIGGYVIAPLEDGANGKVLEMDLGMTDGFSPSVNVIRQPFNDTLDAYIAQTIKQFEHIKFEIVRSEKLDDHTALIEYSGAARDKKIHSYEKIIWSADHVMIAASTCTAGQWDQVGDKLRACVDSFGVEKGKVGEGK